MQINLYYQQFEETIVFNKKQPFCYGLYSLAFLLSMLSALIFLLARALRLSSWLWGARHFWDSLYKTAASPRVIIIAPDPRPAAINNLSMDTRGLWEMTLVLRSVTG